MPSTHPLEPHTGCTGTTLDEAAKRPDIMIAWALSHSCSTTIADLYCKCYTLIHARGRRFGHENLRG
jgi:hypothetical protein